MLYTCSYVKSYGLAFPASWAHTWCLWSAGHQGTRGNPYPLMDYIYRTWIRNTVFPIDHWSVFVTAICTNIVIGWHKGRFNTRVATRGPVPFYHLIKELYAEATGIPLQLRMVAEGAIYMYRALEVPEEENQTDQGKVFGLWEQYCQRTLSASHLFQECAIIYRPPAH